METALSLLDFACESADCVLVVYDTDKVLVVYDLISHSLDFEDVPLVALADVDLAGALVCGSHRIHCKFVGLLLKSVTVFELADDAIARCDA
jgi:hypothetical protein